MNIEWISDNFNIAFAFIVAWVLAWIVASLIYRKVKGSGIEKPPAESIAFEERYASGRSHKRWYTSIGGAHNCLVVTVTDTKLYIRSFFPFNLMFVPEFFDLEHQIKLEDIERIDRTKSLFRDKVRVQFGKSGSKQAVELRLRDPDAFLKAAQT